ncbi:hypothetical protein LJK87_19160 [Paenibacillus sp. P25]|nr:hypothetical protein LJK87_19160 [Paenibacillus sp. P25]
MVTTPSTVTKVPALCLRASAIAVFAGMTGPSGGGGSAGTFAIVTASVFSALPFCLSLRLAAPLVPDLIRTVRSLEAWPELFAVSAKVELYP